MSSSAAVAQATDAFPDAEVDPGQPSSAPSHAGQPSQFGLRHSRPAASPVQYSPPGGPQPGFGYDGGYPAQPLALSSGPVYLPYRDGSSAPPGYEMEESVRGGLVAAGLITWGVPYFTGLGIAASEGWANRSSWVAAPLVGPWVALTSREDSCSSGGGSDDEVAGSVDVDDSRDVQRCVAEPMVRAMLVVSGVLQLTGGVLFSVGLSKERRYVRRDFAQVAVLPRIGPGVGGVDLVGRF